MDFGALFAAFIAQWLYLAGGSLVALVLALATWWRGEKVSANEIVWPMMVCVVLALMGAWNDEHKARHDAETKSAADVADFGGQLGPVIFADGPHGLDLYQEMMVSNSGAAGSAHGYSLVIDLPGREITARPEPIPDSLAPDCAGGAFTRMQISAKTALDEKTIDPVAHNAIKQGWLHFVIPGLTVEQFTTPPVYYAVRFMDHKLRRFEVWHEGNRVPAEGPVPSTGGLYCPGLGK